MGVLAWLLFGLIAGAIAHLALPGNDPGGRGFMGIVITIVVGIVGAILGGFIGTALGWGGVTGFDIRSFLIAIGGAILVLIAWRALAGGGLRRHARG
ncbi:MAG: GlsB/YeaQ/YmgE family stress response membrane protein [Tepidiformaceae bacterium]